MNYTTSKGSEQIPDKPPMLQITGDQCFHNGPLHSHGESYLLIVSISELLVAQWKQVRNMVICPPNSGELAWVFLQDLLDFGQISGDYISLHKSYWKGKFDRLRM